MQVSHICFSTGAGWNHSDCAGSLSFLGLLAKLLIHHVHSSAPVLWTVVRTASGES